MLNLDYVVTGTGRCGTVFFSRLLTSLEIPCSHEGIFTNTGLEKALNRLKHPNAITNSFCSHSKEYLKTKQVVAESSYMAAPYLDIEELSNTKIIHIVRHPIMVIYSFVNDFGYFSKKSTHSEANQYLNFIYSWIPELRNNSYTALDRAALYYVRWNKLIAGKGNKQYLFHKIEDDITPVLAFIEKEATEHMYSDTKANSRRRKPLNHRSLDDLTDEDVKKEVLAICEEYGYSSHIANTKKFRMFT